MKKITCVGLVLLVLFACASAPGGITAEDRAAIDTVVNSWVKALQAKDLEAFAAAYWPDVVHTSKNVDGSVAETVRGIEDLKVQQQEFFSQGDFFARIVYSEPQRDFESLPGKAIYTISGKLDQDQWGWQDIFQLAKRKGEWRIIDHVLIGLP
jgi:uncharacterized protein (TIGR02246 family)